MRHPLRFHAWNMAGRLAMFAGSALHRAGLWLCGCAGALDATADRHR